MITKLLTKIPLIEFAISLIIIFLPLSNNSDFILGIQTAKSFNFFYSIMVLVCIGSLGLLFKKDKVKLNITAIDLILLAFVGWVTLNKYLLHDVHAFSLRYFELLGLSVLYIIVRSVDRKYAALFLVTICISGIVQAVYGNLQLWGFYPSHHSSFKMTGSFFNPGPFAGYLCGILPIALGLYWMTNHKVQGIKISYLNIAEKSNGEAIKREASNSETSNAKPQTSEVSSNKLINKGILLVSLATIISILLVLPTTSSRAAWLGAIAGVAYLAWHKYNVSQRFKRATSNGIPMHIGIKHFKREITFRNRTIIAVLALMLLAGSLSLYLFKKDSADGRILIWRVTTNIIKDYPLSGVGHDMFLSHYMDYQAEYFKSNPVSKYKLVAGNIQFVFNEFLKLLVENGMVGLLLILAILILFFSGRSSLNKKDVQIFNANELESSKIQTAKSLFNVALNIQTILIAAILSLLVFSCFAYPSEILPIKVIVVVILAIGVKLLSNGEAIKQQNIKHSNGKTSNFQAFKQRSLHTTLALVFLSISIFTIKDIVKLKQAYITWNGALEQYYHREYKGCLEKYAKAYPLLKSNGDFLLNYGKALSIANKHNEAIRILEQSKSYLTSTITYTALGDSYQKAGKNDMAEQAYFNTLNMCPDRFYPLYLLAKHFEHAGRKKDAIEFAQQIINKPIRIPSTAIAEMKSEMANLIDRCSEIEENIDKEQNANHGHTQNPNYVEHTQLKSTCIDNEKHEVGDTANSTIEKNREKLNAIEY